MKTFTNYAEKKAKQFLNLLQGYTKGIRMTAILILLLMGVSNAWAYDISAGSHIYLVNTGNWSGCQLYIWKSDYNTYYTFSKITNTNIYHYHFANSWNGYAGVKFRSDANWSKQSSGDITQDLSSCYFVGTGTTKYTTLANMNRAAKVVSMVSTGGNYTEQANSVCIATVSGYNLAANASSTTEVNASTGSASNASINAAYGSTITYTATAGTGYTFKGFSTSNSTSLPASLSASGKTATASGYGSSNNTTYYAYFTANQYTITYKDQGGGAFSGTHASGYPTTHTYGTTTTLKTATKAGYTFDGWFTNSGCTGSAVTSLGATAYTDNIILYAKWTAIAETKYDVTISANANGSVDPSGLQEVGATGINVTATANPGYQFRQWSYTAGAKANPTNTATTLVTATANGTVTASFEEILYNITITSNNAAYGDVNPKSAKAGIATTVNITATPEPGYEFVRWTAPSSITLAANSASTTITKATATGTVSATFQEKKHNVTISYKYSGTDIKSSESKSIGEVSSTNITAPTITGYTFAGWTLGNGVTNKSANATTNPISVITNQSGTYTLTANYERAKYTLNFGVQGIGGSVKATVDGNAITSPSTLEHGSQITLTATAKDGYKFSKWVNGSGAVLSTEATYPHDLIASTTIKAVFTETNVLYLKPGAWTNDGAWFAAYFFNGDKNEWARMKIADPCNIIYKVAIPAGDWTNVIFVRMNKDVQDPSFDGRWNKTGDLTIPTNGDNMFTPNLNSGWDDMNSSWGVYNSDYVPVTYNVTVPEGTPSCYIAGEWNWNEFIEMTKVDDTHYTITLDIACSSHKYKYCYGPSWGCEEVKTTANSTQAVDDRNYNASDNVVAWVKYCLVGADLGWSWNSSYSFDIAGDMNYVFNKKDYHIKVMSSTGKYYTHNGSTYNLHRSHTTVKIPHEGGDNNELIFEADMQGNYHFQFDPVSKQLTIEFPEKGYQLKIKMADGKTVYTSNAVDNAGDIFSFFAPGTTDNTLGGTVELYLNGNKQCTIPAVSFDTSRVYVAKLNSAKNGIDNIAPYTGDYYIRTDGAHGGWNNYKTNADNKMTYFVPREREKYSYYWVAALPQADRNESNGVVNVKACVGNDYNKNLAVTLGGDKFTDGYGNVAIKDPSDQEREKINVRFGYNPKTNFFERAMLTGSGNMENFLNITDPEGKIFKDQNGNTALTEANTDSKFTDVSNWVYETNVWVRQANNGATVCLTATAYNGSINSLFGFEADGVTPKQETIIGLNSGEPREMRIVYDFKTNRMIMAWIPGDNTITDEQSLQADVLFIRHENDDVPQLKLQDGGEIKGIQSQFFALELENDVNNGGNKEHAYWISLPFDCVVGSISGVPGYMSTWGIQRYNGKKRAEIGWFKETYTFWEWLTPNDTLKAGEGYVLSFDKNAATWNTFDVHEKDANGNTISTTQKSLLRLYFPSTETGYLFQENTELTTKYENQPCTITRDNRHIQDGNWKIIATTSYYNAQVKEGEIDNTEGAEYLSEFPKFRYTYWRNPNDRTDWKYTAEQGGADAEYKSFHSYMVQYAGTITWKALNESVMPAGLAARRNSNAKVTNITTRLVIADAEEVQHDQTFVALDEKGTTTFDQNLDLNKIFNSGKANVYTLSEGIPFAGNTLPMGEALVPVGVQIATEGEYTFRMPDGTEGMVVELLDYEANTRTNLLLSDYTVTLQKGSNENRFALYIQPSKSGVSTSIENVDEGVNGGEAVMKYLIDGKLFIRTADGVLYDAQGHVVQ